jgi:hypothetical protein
MFGKSRRKQRCHYAVGILTNSRLDLVSVLVKLAGVDARITLFICVSTAKSPPDGTPITPPSSVFDFRLFFADTCLTQQTLYNPKGK